MPPVNLYLFLNAIYSGIEVTLCEETGVGTLTGEGLSLKVPLSLLNSRSGQIPKDDAVALALASCRIHGPQGFCYSWTRREEPIFKEVVATLRPAMGHFPWQLDAAWRVGRADLYDAVGILFFRLAAELPEAYRLDTLSDRLFTAPWTLDATTACELGKLAKEWGVEAVQCEKEDARLVVAGVPIFIAQRDWALLALNLLFMPELGDRIPEVERARRMLSR